MRGYGVVAGVETRRRWWCESSRSTDGVVVMARFEINRRSGGGGLGSRSTDGVLETRTDRGGE
ncbi:hypothetical protein D8674_031314 [Pyrus ussuriensis x Pyrus communis]|uniref:Uncharacterized protein n=1 Tax=Pyrus ussuriensis x Pyrus communis TaxID=2448454 RepID=A0A5N5FBI1_9ROSA|nr:hypothetical protein D8674_031314 [Pyrus ussuriensis x Pyrus communis]